MKLLPLFAGLLLLSSVITGVAALPVASIPFPDAVKETDVDFAACRIVNESGQEPVDADALRNLLGFSTPQASAPTRRVHKGRKIGEIQYLLVFKEPVAIGTILGGIGELKIPVPGAPFPPDPANPAQWQSIEVSANQSSPRFAPLPPGATTRAILLSVPDLSNGSAVLRFITPRLLNLTPDAIANAQAEFTSEPFLSAPVTYDAGRITRGNGEWISSGKDGRGINSTPPITELAPTWFVLSWPGKQQIDGVLLQDNFEQFDLQVFNGPAGINPAVATDDDWKTIKKFKQSLNGVQRWLTFDAEHTRALRLRITKTKEEAVARLTGFHAFTDLGANHPVPAAAQRVTKGPPVSIPYEMLQDGQVTLVVDGPDGTRVRNLIANVQQNAGKNATAWDLKDENGAYVAPGKYHWKAITHPPLELRYEMTVYPNVNNYFPERPAWLTGMDGSGGWMADHSAPIAGCAVGDSVFIGSPVSESGVSLIECDLEGRKLWGRHDFAAWTGCAMLASDGKNLFNTNTSAGFAKAGLDKTTDSVWAVDLKTREVRTVAMLQPTAERKRGVQGFAAHDNKVYLAIHAPDNWLNNAVTASDVDSLNSLPAYGTPRKERAPHEVVFDPRTDFLRLFRLKDTPPGQGSTNAGLSWLETTKTADRQQHIVLAFKKPVAIGSLVFPPPPKEDKVQFQISILKPGAPYPPRPQEKEDWQVIPLTDKSAWAVQALPEGTTTRALRLTFLRGGEGAADDILSDVEDKKSGPSLDTIDPASAKKSSFEGADEGLWQRRLEGMKLLGRRFENLFDTATVRVNSGKVASDGAWDAQRTEPLSVAQPGIYAMEWKQPQSIRGLAIKEIDGEETEVDAFTGPADASIDIEANDGWEKVASYKQPLRDYYQPDPFHNSLARYLDGYVDFGREINTRAIRLRVVKQWDTKIHHPSGVRADQGGQTLDLKRCHVYGVAPLKYLGGEPPVDPMVTQRLEVLDADTGKIIQETPLPGAGTPGGGEARGNCLAFNAQGELFALADNKLVCVDLKSGQPKFLADDLIQPTTLACDAQGNFFVFDAAKERKNIRVYSPEGKFLREIGATGGYQAGPWDPNRMEAITALSVDQRGQVWAVDHTYWPKRVSLWSHEGQFLKEFLGPTEYGGGGCIDPGDKRRFFYGPLEFELDWKTGKSRLKNLTSLDGWDTSDVPRRVNDRLYLVNTRPTNVHAPCGLVYLHDGDRARLVAAIGIAGDCKQMLDPKLVKAFGGKVLMDYICVWSDLNGDGQVQPDEVQLWPKPKEATPVTFDNQLGAQIGPIGFRVKQWLPNGVPVYERVDSPGLWNGRTVRLDNGNFYHVEGDGRDTLCAALQPDGKPLWTYRTEGSGVQALTRSKPRSPGQIVAELGIAGHVTAQAGDLGEFLVFNTNVGAFNIITADGLFAGQFFSDLRDPLARPWSMTENTRGMRLDGITPGQEHFGGYFCGTEDGHYYVVAGHNHASIVEVGGIDQFKRFSGEITVGDSDLAATRAWEHENVAHQVYARAPVIDCYRVAAPPKLDGKLNDWPGVSSELDDNAKFRIAYDDENLYVAYEISQRGPLKNQGRQWDRLFKTGASVDLQIGVDPNAPEDRAAPVAGDERLLLTFTGDTPAAVLYQSIVPGVPADKAWQSVSGVASVSFDRVTRLEKPKFIAVGDNDHYVAEAAIPLSALGLKITPGLLLKMDWGVLVSGPDGTEVMRREYWSNKFTQMVADEPTEAAIHPELWGHIRFHAETADAQFDPTAKKPEKALDDLLNDLK